MFSTLQIIITNLISSGIAFILGYFFPKLWRKLKYGKKFPSSLIFWKGIEDEVIFVTCLHIADIPDGKESNPKYIGFGDSKAMKLVFEQLKRNGFLDKPIKIREYYYGKLLEEDKNNNIVCIGGGLTNRVTTEFLYSMKVPRHFFDEIDSRQPFESKVVRNKDNSWNITPIVIDGKVESDIGIIVKSYHPSYPDKTIIILAGAYSFGTLAAAKFATNENLMKNYQHIIESDRFEFILRAEVNDMDVSKIIVEWAEKF